MNHCALHKHPDSINFQELCNQVPQCVQVSKTRYIQPLLYNRIYVCKLVFKRLLRLFNPLLRVQSLSPLPYSISVPEVLNHAHQTPGPFSSSVAAPAQQIPAQATSFHPPSSTFSGISSSQHILRCLRWISLSSS